MKLRPRKPVPPALVRIFAIIGLITTVLVAIFVIMLAYDAYSAPSEPDQVILSLNFDKPIVEQNSESALDLVTQEGSTPLLDILHAIDSANADPRVKGLVAHFGGTQPSLAQAEEIAAAIARFRHSGKFTYAFGSTYGDFGNGNRAYFLASGFENIWLQPAGAVSLTGVAIQAPFGKTALEKIGVTGDFMRREEYKSFEETFTRDNFSPPVHANMQSMIDDLADQVAGGVAAWRKWDVAHVKQLMEQGPYTADEAFKLGLVTHIGNANELDDELKKKAGEDAEQVDVEDYLAFANNGGAKAKVHVALIFGTGLITDHASGPTDVADGDVMGADQIAGAFDDAAADKKIKAIIFRVDSPGGSPEASETIRAALMHAQKAGKPVFVSMGNVAASGGYWISMNADSITAEPATLTGSIGVVAGKFVIGGLLQKLGIGWDTLTTGGNAAMWSMTEEFTPEQRARMNVFLDETYRDFVRNVSAARKIPMSKMPDIAKGRVFTGAQGVKAGLVDQLGGFDVTLAVLRKKLDLKPTDMLSIELLPAPLSPAEKVMKILKGIGLEGAMMHSALGQWAHLQALAGPLWSEMNSGPIEARMPAAVMALGH